MDPSNTRVGTKNDEENKFCNNQWLIGNYCKVISAYMNRRKGKSKYDGQWTIEMIIDHIFNREERESMVKQCSICKCCDRHQRNRPKSVENWLELRGKKGSYGANNNSGCVCSCRQFSRQICRSLY